MTTQVEEEVTEELEIEGNEPDIKDQIADQLDKVDPPSVPDIETEQEEEKAPEYVAKLNGYTNAEREKLATLPSDIQRVIDDREEKFHKGIEQYKEKASFANTIEQVLRPERELLQQANMSPDQYVSRLVSTERQLRSENPRERIQAIQAIANDYGIPLEALTQVQFDPYAYNLRQQNEALKMQHQQTQASTQSAEEEQISNVINDFAADQAHEHFEQVRPLMAELLDKGLAKDLDEAYEKAIRLDDGVFSKYQAAKLEEQKRLEAEKANQAAKAAKAAAVSVKGSPAGRNSAPVYATTHDAVKGAFDALGL